MSEKDHLYYDKVYEEGGYKNYYLRDPLTVPAYSELWKAAAECLSAAERVVDLGCGPGQFAEVLRTVNDAPYTGYDFSKVAIQKANERGLKNCEFIQADLLAAVQPKDSQFVCLEVLEHIEKDRELLQRIPEGTPLVFSVPTYASAGHVRVFPSPSSVEARYGNILTMKLVREIAVGPTKKIFLFAGSRQ